MRKFFLLLLLFLVLGAAGVGGYLYYEDQIPPSIGLAPGEGFVNKNTVFAVNIADKGAGIRRYEAYLLADDKRYALRADSNVEGKKTAMASFSLDATDIEDGPFELVVKAVDASWYRFGEGNMVEARYSFTLDTKAPNIAVQSAAHNITRGGSNLIAYTVNEEPLRSGVLVGDVFFPGYKQKSGTYLCFFAFPQSVELAEFSPVLLAEDAAGNLRKRGFVHFAKAKAFRNDRINIGDRFLNNKMPQFEDTVPGAMTALDRFIKVNRQLRKANRAAHFKYAADTTPQVLWDGTFERMKGAPMAGFGDRRTYYYNGKEIDKQTHLGADIASTRAASVPAANNGEIVHAGFFGIYGETVIIDHGLGIMSLYAHLSQINVQLGDMVKKGQSVGRTGATGLAGGDHLHFGIYVSGVPVNPLEWWDAGWIRDNLKEKLEIAAGEG
jgi:hypothetical protein